MANVSLSTQPLQDKLPSSRAGQLDSPARREIVHELMNQLTVVNLCAGQLRSTVCPFMLSSLERAVENALRAAKALAAEISSGTISNS